jgi:hypothetical protein
MKVDEIADYLARRLMIDLGEPEDVIRHWLICSPAWLELMRFRDVDVDDERVDLFYDALLAAARGDKEKLHALEASREADARVIKRDYGKN